MRVHRHRLGRAGETQGKIAAAGLHTDILAIPFAPLAYFISIMVALSSAAMLIRAVRGLSDHEIGIE